MIDLSHLQIKLKTDQTSNAQRAVQTAIKTIDSRGSLTANAPKSVVTEYLRQSGASTYVNQAVGSGVHYDENQTYKSGAVCKQRNINLTGGSTINARMPYMVIQIDSERKLGTASSSFPMVPNPFLDIDDSLPFDERLEDVRKRVDSKKIKLL